MEWPLNGKRIAVLVESEFIPGEIDAYRTCFPLLGAQVDFITRLWGQDKQVFVSDVEIPGATPQTLDVTIDIDKVSVNDYAAVLMAANYTSVRLRYFDPSANPNNAPGMVATPPAVRFFAEAMKNPKIVKGALCHALWILTPVPTLLKDRKVICHEVVLADIINAGAQYTWDPSGVVVDRDLVTGHDWHVVVPYIRRIVEQIR